VALPGDLEKGLRRELTTGNYAISKPAKPQSIGSLFDQPYPTAEADFFVPDLEIEMDGVVRVAFAHSASGVLRCKLVRNAVEKVLDYNAGASLVANAIYAFDLPVKAGDKFNLRYSVAGTIHLCEVQFILLPV